MKKLLLPVLFICLFSISLLAQNTQNEPPQIDTRVYDLIESVSAERLEKRYYQTGEFRYKKYFFRYSF